jgi:hypothetical protein
MPEKRKKMEVALPSEEKELKEEPKKGLPEKELPIWNFPLQGRSVRARNLAEAEEKIKAKE